jgi:hypothetical protein
VAKSLFSSGYERCDGKHRGGDTCTSEKGHTGDCTFGTAIEPKRAPVRRARLGSDHDLYSNYLR